MPVAAQRNRICRRKTLSLDKTGKSKCTQAIADQGKLFPESAPAAGDKPY